MIIKMIKLIFSTFSLGFLSVLFNGALAFAPADGDVEKGKQLYQSCIACHGDKGQGNDTMQAPALAGQYSWYLSMQLDSFNSGKRGTQAGDTAGMQMVPMAKLVAEETAKTDILAYIATFDLESATKPELDAETMRNGSRQYNAQCSACHGNNGKGNAALKSPNLTSLSQDYLTRQLQNYKAGIRGYHQDDKYGRQMKMMANTISNDKNLKDIVSFIQTLDK
ncbi:c-type cytochrome [Thalassotalea mangrovi]|uniref:Cytochrome c n=1 Tax=Thalassotalea mangrovi TaxID=2572245 RepID=A0A4U1B4I3_9GAMM|nr:c-type cytochrome [Thalassotalea mangrovi]TKB45119.1 cytochrome c [Thalassotalea mangrovi]